MLFFSGSPKLITSAIPKLYSKSHRSHSYHDATYPSFERARPGEYVLM